MALEKGSPRHFSHSTESLIVANFIGNFIGNFTAKKHCNFATYCKSLQNIADYKTLKTIANKGKPLKL